MSILEILSRHIADVCNHGDIECRCGEQCDTPEDHRTHLAQVLEQHEREREAAALEEAAHAIASAEINLEIFEGQDHLKELWAHSNRTRVGIVTSLRERAARLKATP